MFLSISTQHQPASDLGFLFHKHPDRVHKIDLPFGKATVYFPELSDERSTAVLHFEVDPIGLVRGWGGGGNSHGDIYVNDRPYVSSSLFSLAISKAYRSAMNGVSKERPELAQASLPFEVYIPTVSSPSGKASIIEFFEPLGYQIQIEESLLDSKFPEWGQSSYFQITLKNTLPLSLLLRHLYVLLPVLDGTKHYWVHHDEISKLIEKGEGWLATHPARQRIVNRYLKGQKDLTREAVSKLSEGLGELPSSLPALTRVPNLNEVRMSRVAEVLKDSHSSRILDMGCGQGALIKELLKDKQFTEILGVDVSTNALKKAKNRLQYEEFTEQQKSRVGFKQGSLVYYDKRFRDFDAVALIEVIEHLEPERLPTMERVLFECAKPKMIIITTPNQTYNHSIEALGLNYMRHSDHRFEWTQAEFESWSNKVAEKYGYQVRFEMIGALNDDNIAPTQMGVFTR